MRYNKDVPRPPHGRTPRRTGKVQCYSTALLVAGNENLRQELCPRLRNMSVVQNRSTTNETLFPPNGRSFYHMAVFQLLDGLHHGPSTSERTQLNPRGGRPGVDKGDNSHPMRKNYHRRRDHSVTIRNFVQTFWTTGQHPIGSRTPVCIEGLCRTVETIGNKVVIVNRLSPPDGWNYRKGQPGN